MEKTKKTYRDYSAELFVAGRLADADWNVYFPHRDKGFDFVIAKRVGEEIIIRPVQVKGKYPTGAKSDKPNYGYVGTLTQLHPDMVLAIPYFSPDPRVDVPLCVAYMPRPLIRKNRRGYRCQPAQFKQGRPIPKRDSASFFDENGIRRLELEEWSTAFPGRKDADANTGTNDNRDS